MALFNALLPNQEELLAQDPFYLGGVGALRSQTAAPRNSTEAFLLPIMKGFGSGALMGVGEGRVEQKMAPSYESLIGALTGDAYTFDGAEKGQSDLLAALMGREERQAQQSALADVLADVQKRELMLPIFEREQAIKGKINPEGTSVKVDTGFGAASADKLYEQKAVIDEALAIADEVKRSGLNYAQLQAGSMFSGLDPDQINARISNLADKVLRTRTGASAPEPERQGLKKIIAGDFSAGPETISALLNQYALGEASAIKSKLKAAESLKGGLLEAELDDLLSSRPKQGVFAGEQKGSTTQNVPPGMKLERNRKTGETRLVPK